MNGMGFWRLAANRIAHPLQHFEWGLAFYLKMLFFYEKKHEYDFDKKNVNFVQKNLKLNAVWGQSESQAGYIEFISKFLRVTFFWIYVSRAQLIYASEPSMKAGERFMEANDRFMKAGDSFMRER